MQQNEISVQDKYIVLFEQILTMFLRRPLFEWKDGTHKKYLASILLYTVKH
jgi:hypothetical protein